MRYLKRFLAVGAASAILAGPVYGQGQPVFDEFVSVELVVVDVVVQDGTGEPVLDLTEDDFRLFQDGVAVEISQFTAPPGRARAAVAPAGAGTPSATLAPRRIVIFIDNLHLHPNSKRRVFEKLGRTLDGHLADEDEVMVVSFGGTTRVELEMTTNRRALKSVLREQADSGAVSLLASYDEMRILEVMQQIRFSANQGTELGTQACLGVGTVAHSHAQQVYGRVQATVSELRRFVNSLAGYEGPKMLLHVSDGIPLVAGSEAYHYATELCDGTGLNKGIPNAVDMSNSNALRYNYWDPTQTAATLREFDTADEWSRLASDANTYQVSFYTFQAERPSNRSGNVDGTRTSFDVEKEGERNKQDTLFLLADETGGAALLDAKEVDSALQRMSDDSRFGYQLAFEPPTASDGRLHRLRVEVDRPGIDLRYRKSYRSKPLEERIEDRVVSALLHGRLENPLAVRLDVTETAAGKDGTHTAHVRVRVPLDQLVLLPEDDVLRGLFTVFVAAVNEFEQMTPVGRRTVPLSVPITHTEEAFVYAVDVPVRGAKGAVAVAVQDQLGAEISYLRENLQLPGG